MAGFANIPAERGAEGGIVSRSERRACVRIAQNGQCLLGLTTRGFSAWATHWATSDAARSGRARPASAVARGAGGPGGPDALVGLPGGPWRPRPATCPALLAQLFGCTQSESLSLTRGSERLPTSGRLGDIAGIDKRALRSAEAAISNPLMDDFSLRGARGVLISITGGKDLTLYEVDEAATRIREEVDADANIIVGATFEESLDGIIRVSVVATGVDINSASNAGPAVSPHAPAPPQGRAA